MKLNGKNIITDQDITITGGNTSLGDNLSDIITNQQDSIDQLKSNVKWIYKYGGVGGSGGGGSSSQNWGINATLNNIKISEGNTISLEKPGKYTLSIAIQRGQGAYFCTYTYEGRKGTVTLNENNGWRYKVDIELIGNGVITIEVDNTSEIVNAYANYITTPYIFSNLQYIKNDGSVWSGDIFISDAKQSGLKIRSQYSIAIDGEFSYNWIFNGEMVEEGEILNKNGEIVFTVPEEYLEDSKAGLYSIQLILSITPSGQTTSTVEKTSQFNLIPKGLFLKLETPIGLIYDTNSIEDPYQYSTNRNISFQFRVYKGATSDQKGEMKLYLNDETSPRISMNITDGIIWDLQTSVSTPGWHKLRFEYSLSGDKGTTIKYLYATEVETELDWYLTQPVDVTFYRYGNKSNQSYLKDLNGIYSSFYASSDSTFNSLQITTNDSGRCGYDTIIHLGIQYSHINNIDNPIAILYTLSGNSYNKSIEIYQNKIIIAGQECNIYLGKQNNYDPDDATKYHLITITSRFIKYDGSNAWRENCIYIDGILEGAVESWSIASRTMARVEFCPGNYSINLFEQCHFPVPDFATKEIISDIDILSYYYTYKIKSINTEEIKRELQPSVNILNSLYSNNTYNYSFENAPTNLLKLAATNIMSSISQNSDVPTMMITINRTLVDGKTNIFDWLNGSFLQENDSSSTHQGTISIKQPVSISYCNPGNDIAAAASKIEVPSTLGNNTGFYLSLQGSSTMRYKSKNFTLSLINTDTTEGQGTPLFSPNFSSEDSSTFLPEQEFTLKADVVDSSHTNNVAVGKFINRFNTFDYSTGLETAKYRSYIKKCLEGFPFLMFLQIPGNADLNIDPEYFYLGIYNFNLGRSSYYNLGYSDITLFEDKNQSGFGGIMTDGKTPFMYSLAPSSNTVKNPNFAVAEIQGNNKYWDFHQYQPSVLFKAIDGEDSGNFMYGDLVQGSAQTARETIQKFTKSIAGAGGYIFKEIGKKFGDISDDLIAYHKYDIESRTVTETIPDSDGNIITTKVIKNYYLPYVPNVDVQYIRNQQDGEFSRASKDTPGLLSPVSELNISILKSCLFDSEAEGTTRNLNYESLVYYYTTCMAFGLVDSVQKNMNIKSWDGKTFGLFFYDMDTCLGTSNSGEDTSYFCFTDYWRTKKELQEVDSIEKEVITGCNVIRDYYPIESEDGSVLPHGYDVPSSYLFAIAKYASCSYFQDKLGDEGQPVTLLSPQQVWADWRRIGTGYQGPLSTADKFIDEFFAGHLNGVPDIMISLNYRHKYLSTGEANSSTTLGFNNMNWTPFRGRKVEKVRDWLRGRFHILDAYFNLGREVIKVCDLPENIITEPLCLDNNLNSNPDIYILHDIFSAKGATINRSNATIYVTLKAQDYSPLIHRNGNYLERFLFQDSKETYTFKVTYAGNQTSKFGGSSLWTWVDDFTPFISSMNNKTGFRLHSDLLEEVTATTSTMAGNWDLSLPATKSLTLTSGSYSGNVSINDSFYNLSKINISGSKISLSVTGSNVSEINASNVIANKFKLDNCKNIKSVNINNINVTDCEIQPCWPLEDTLGILDLGNIKAKNLTIKGREAGEDKKRATLKISNSSELTRLNFTEFEHIEIINCTNLKEISCNDTIEGFLKSVKIINCPSLTSLKLDATLVKSVDLTGCIKLTELIFKGKSFEQLKTLNLSETSIYRIIYEDPSWEGKYDNTLLDLRPLVNLNTEYKPEEESLRKNDYGLILKRNSKVTAVLVDNQRYFAIWNTFEGCVSLERLYGWYFFTGRYNSNVGSIFRNLTKFSIHGSNLSEIKWKNYPVFSGNSYPGTILMPYQILGWTIEEAKTKALDKTDIREFRQSGVYVTNFEFDDKSTYSSSLEAFLYGTGSTIFDIYYILSILTSKQTTLSSFAYNPTISEKTSHKFYWDIIETDAGSKEVNNSPHEHMFYKCGEVTTLNSAFHTRATGIIKLASPEVDNSGNILQDNGLFSPLIKITGLSTIFYGGSLIFDRFIFRRVSDKYSNLSNITYFASSGVNWVVNNIKEITSLSQIPTSASDISLDMVNTWGNISEFFNDTPNITKTNGLQIVMNNMGYLNWKTTSEGGFKIPISSENCIISASFTSNYAFGTINFKDYFSIEDKPKISQVDSSFRVKSLNGFEDYGYGANVYFDNFFFKGFTNLKTISNRESGDHSISDTKYGSSFSGRGLQKYIVLDENNSFPYEIFSESKKLEKITGLFAYSKTTKDADDIKLPGTLFINLPKLSRLDNLFWDIDFGIGKTFSLSETNTIKGEETNFVNNPQLTSLLGLFGKEINSNSGYPRLVGMIPHKFFYHGETNISTTYKGTNILSITKGEAVDSEGNIIYDDLGNAIMENKYAYGTPQEITISSKIPIASITNLSYCFQNSNLAPFENPIPENEVIPTFQPFKYLLKNNSQVAEDLLTNPNYWKNGTQQLVNLTYMWGYDGYNKPDLMMVDDLTDNNGNLIDSGERNELGETIYLSNQFEYLDEVDLSGEKDLNSWGSITDNLKQYEFRETSLVQKLTKSSDYSIPYSPYFSTSPDLFRYCSDSCKIDYIFAYSGVSNTWSWGYNEILNPVGEKIHIFDYGMYGRLCPYLLKPLNNLLSVEGVFKYCRRLGFYIIKNNSGIPIKEQIIPETFFSYSPKITKFNNCFEGWFFPNKSSLSNLFNNYKTTSLLSVNRMFYNCYWIGNEESPLKISRVFKNVGISNATKCFCYNDSVLEQGHLSDLNPDQYVLFDDVFKGYTSSSYENDITNFSYVFAGYKKGYVIHESIKTLVANTITKNYYYDNNEDSLNPEEEIVIDNG